MHFREVCFAANWRVNAWAEWCISRTRVLNYSSDANYFTNYVKQRHASQVQTQLSACWTNGSIVFLRVLYILQILKYTIAFITCCRIQIPIATPESSPYANSWFLTFSGIFSLLVERFLWLSSHIFFFSLSLVSYQTTTKARFCGHHVHCFAYYTHFTFKTGRFCF